MNREELTFRIQEGFFEIAPDIFDEIAEAIEQPVEDMVIELKDRKKSKSIYSTVGFKVLRRVAMLILVIGLGLSIYGLEKNQNVYVVAMDVNPSIRMELNKDYNVRKITGLNTDGEKLINKLGWEKNSSVEQTVETITDKMVSEGYLTENGGILITLLKKNEKHDYEELKNILNQELENDVVKCGMSGVKIAFQTVDTNTDKTGKEILKERMVEEYHIDDNQIHDMNIRDMFDYIESENSENQIIENVVRSNERKTVHETAKPNDETISSDHKMITEKKNLSQEKNAEVEYKNENNSQSVTTEGTKNKQETENTVSSRDNVKETAKPSDSDSKKTQNTPTPTVNTNSQEKTTQVNSKNNQEKWSGTDSKNQQNIMDSDNKNNQVKLPETGKDDNKEDSSESDKKDDQDKWTEPDNYNQWNWFIPEGKYNQENWVVPDNNKNLENWSVPDNIKNQENWFAPDYNNNQEKGDASKDMNNRENGTDAEEQNNKEKPLEQGIRNNQELRNFSYDGLKEVLENEYDKILSDNCISDDWIEEWSE